MAVETKCQTNGAVYNTEISSNNISVNVSIPFSLELSEEEAALLDANIHNVLELVLAPYFNTKTTDSIDYTVKNFNDWSSSL